MELILRDDVDKPGPPRRHREGRRRVSPATSCCRAASACRSTPPNRGDGREGEERPARARARRKGRGEVRELRVSLAAPDRRPALRGARGRVGENEVLDGSVTATGEVAGLPEDPKASRSDKRKSHSSTTCPSSLPAKREVEGEDLHPGVHGRRSGCFWSPRRARESVSVSTEAPQRTGLPSPHCFEAREEDRPRGRSSWTTRAFNSAARILHRRGLLPQEPTARVLQGVPWRRSPKARAEPIDLVTLKEDEARAGRRHRGRWAEPPAWPELSRREFAPHHEASSTGAPHHQGGSRSSGTLIHAAATRRHLLRGGGGGGAMKPGRKESIFDMPARGGSAAGFVGMWEIVKEQA